MITLRWVPELWRRQDVIVRDSPLALLLIGMSFLPALYGHETQVGDLPARPFDGFAVLALLLLCLPLTVRRRWPAVSLALVTVGFLIAELGSYHLVAGTAMPLAVVSAGAHLERYRRVTVLVLSAVYVGLAIALTHLGSQEGVDGFTLFYLASAVAWAVGSWLRAARATEETRRRLVAQTTRSAERARIARELHDVVTHHVTAMVVQAEAARYLTAVPERLDETLSAVTDTGRRAMTDLRHMLDVLSHDDGPGDRTPAVGELKALVEQTRQAGQPVELTEEGRPGDLGGSVALVTYRVVQEALTNALKYAHGSRTVVRVHYGAEEVSMEIGNDGTGQSASAPGGSGRGLAGMRDRVGALGGEFSAGRQDGGGFVVRARIPAETS